MAATLYLDGTDASTYGVYPRGVPDGWLDSPRVDASVVDLGGRVGGVLPSTRGVAARRLSIPIGVNATSGGTTTREGYEEWLKAFLDATVTVRIDEGATAKEIDGVLTQVALRPFKLLGVPVSNGTLTFLCPDPRWKATMDTTETISGTPNVLALGNAPVDDWVLTITATTNSITDITVTLGAYTLVWTGTIAAGQALVIDASDYTVENNGVNAISTYTGGFPSLVPSASPSVSAVKASGSGTLGGSLVYRRRWW